MLEAESHVDPSGQYVEVGWRPKGDMTGLVLLWGGVTTQPQLNPTPTMINLPSQVDSLSATTKSTPSNDKHFGTKLRFISCPGQLNR